MIILYCILTFSFTSLASYFMLQGTGFFPEPHYLEVLCFSLMLLFFIAKKRLFYGILLPITLLFIFYSPVGLTFGPPSYHYVASVLATDLQESKEFFQQIPLINIAKPLLALVSLLFAFWISQKNKIDFRRNSLLLTLSLGLFFSYTPAFKFIAEGYNAIWQVAEEIKRLNQLQIPSQWGESHLDTQNPYQDFVLIIGESARRDYHHAYGYPVENTPFMSSAKGTLIEGLTSGGSNTISSLKLMLTLPDKQNWQENYALNVVDLVKSAGIKTYWLSNQGYMGTYDTPISAIANKSDERFFLKSGDSFHQNTSDFALLPQLEKLLKQPANGKRFIVLHLYGSHPISCDRLTDYPKIFADEQIDKKYANINCYISTIKKTDEILKKVYDMLSNNSAKRPFSMLYFADHGLAHQQQGEDILLMNSHRSPFHFEIPLFKISSDDKQRQQFKAFKSALNFTQGIANWMGIRNEKLATPIDLFSPESDPDDFGLKNMIKHIKTAPDPAIVIKINESKKK